MKPAGGPDVARARWAGIPRHLLARSTQITTASQSNGCGVCDSGVRKTLPRPSLTPAADRQRPEKAVDSIMVSRDPSPCLKLMVSNFRSLVKQFGNFLSKCDRVGVNHLSPATVWIALRVAVTRYRSGTSASRVLSHIASISRCPTMSQPESHSFRKLLPGFVIAAGTQVVLKVAKSLFVDDRFKPAGSVGVVMKSPPITVSRTSFISLTVKRSRPVFTSLRCAVAR